MTVRVNEPFQWLFSPVKVPKTRFDGFKGIDDLYKELVKL
jgi:hypothetical protein